MIPSLLVTLNVAKLTPGKIPLGRNNQHKIKLKTAKMAHSKAERVQQTTNWQNPIFLTACQLQHLTWGNRTLQTWRPHSEIDSGSRSGQGDLMQAEASRGNQIFIQIFKWKRIDPNENDLENVTREIKEMKTVQQRSQES